MSNELVIRDDKYDKKVNKNDNNYLHFNSLRKGDLISIDCWNKRRIENTQYNSPPYLINNNFKEVSSTFFTKISDVNTTEQGNKELIEFSPILYPENTKILLLKNILLR